jgi:hypothetical protein
MLGPFASTLHINREEPPVTAFGEALIGVGLRVECPGIDDQDHD